MPRADHRQSYVLVIRPVDGRVADELRLKRALKALLRRHGLRVLSIAPLSPEASRDAIESPHAVAVSG